MRPKVSNKTLTSLDLQKTDNRKIAKKKIDEIDNLLEMSLRLNRFPPIFQTIREIPGIARRPRATHDLRLGRNQPIDFMLIRRKPEQTFVFRILSAVNLKFSFANNKFEEIFQQPYWC